MKVVIQHPVTHHYLTPANEWTPDSRDARLFISSAQAVSFALKNVKPPFNVVLKFEDRQYDLAVFTHDVEKPNVVPLQPL